jgi:CubicO group peptidase (beta-lactamase class C family)
MNDLKDQIRQRVERAISEKVFPGCTIGVITPKGKSVFSFGYQTYEEEKKVTESTIYDVASITKGVVMASVLLSLIDDGEISLDDRLVDYLPEFDTSPKKREVKIEHLLTYTVDLKVPATSEVLEMPLNKAMKKLLEAELRSPAGEKYLYTNLTALLMGLVVERVAAKRLDKLSKEKFFVPLGMDRTSFHPEDFSLEEISPTEKKDRLERAVHGVVHDEATFLLQEAGHYLGISGLFSTASDLLIFLSMILQGGELNGKRYFSEGLVDKMLSPQFSADEEAMGLGWNLGAVRYMGDLSSEKTFGITGFTGCLLVGDRERRAGFVLLSNHVYPKRPENSDAINSVRHDIADIVWQYVDSLNS